MSEETLKFNNVILNEKEFHKPKESIDLFSIVIDQIVVSHKFKYNNENFKHFTGYQKGEIFKPLFIILPEMGTYIKYFENRSNNMSFLIKDDEVQDKYDEIWYMIKDKLGITFHSKPVYEQKHVKAKVR